MYENITDKCDAELMKIYSKTGIFCRESHTKLMDDFNSCNHEMQLENAVKCSSIQMFNQMLLFVFVQQRQKQQQNQQQQQKLFDTKKKLSEEE